MPAKKGIPNEELRCVISRFGWNERKTNRCLSWCVFISQIYRTFFFWFGRVLLCLWSSKLSIPPLHLLPLTFYLLPLSNFPWKRDTFLSLFVLRFFFTQSFPSKNRSFHFHYNLLIDAFVKWKQHYCYRISHIMTEWIGILLSINRCAQHFIFQSYQTI